MFRTCFSRYFGRKLEFILWDQIGQYGNLFTLYSSDITEKHLVPWKITPKTKLFPVVKQIHSFKPLLSGICVRDSGPKPRWYLRIEKILRRNFISWLNKVAKHEDVFSESCFPSSRRAVGNEAVNKLLVQFKHHTTINGAKPGSELVLSCCKISLSSAYSSALRASTWAGNAPKKYHFTKQE